MALFEDQLDHVQLDSTLGDDAVFYANTGAPLNMKVFFEQNVERVGADGLGISHQHEVEYRKELISTNPVGCYFVISGQNYQVKQLVEDNGQYVTYAVK